MTALYITTSTWPHVEHGCIGTTLQLCDWLLQQIESWSLQMETETDRFTAGQLDELIEDFSNVRTMLLQK